MPFYPLNNPKNKNFEKVTVQKVGALPKNSEKSLLRDLGVNDAKKKFNKFWDIAKNILDEITAVDDIHHSEESQNTGEVVVNMVKAISARDLYEKIQQRHLNKI